MQNLGYFLKAEREKKGIRLEEVASITKIQLHKLKQMEEGNWKALPPKPFIKGFITAYSRYVGLNAQEIYQLYLSETEPVVATIPTDEPETNTALEAPPSPSRAPELSASQIIENPTTLRLKPIIFSGIGVLALGLSIWLIRLGRSSVAGPEAPVAVAQATAVETAEKVDAEKTNREVASAVPAPVAAAPEATTPPATGETTHQIEVIPRDRTWIKVVVDEAPPIEYFLAPSEKATFSATQKIKIVLGNSVGSEVTHNGQKTEGTKYMGTIRSYIFPADAKFPQDKAVRKLTNDSDSLEKSDPTLESVNE
jgi:cytoskeletal protein RodZ